MAAPSPRAPTAWLLVPLVAGYLFAQAIPAMPALLALCGTAFSLGALAAAWSRARFAALAWPALAFVAAILLASAYLQQRLKPPSGWEALPPREAVLTLKIDRLFSSSVAGGKIHGLAAIVETDRHLTELTGRKIYFSMTPSESNETWARSTRLKTTGILEAFPAEISEEDTFTRFLIQSGAQLHYQRVLLREEPGAAEAFWRFCARQHDRFETFLRRGSIENTAAVNVYVAMLLGKRSELSPDQRDAFLQTGTLHLFAISGLHIGVVAFALHTLLSFIRIPPKAGAGVGLTLLFCFVGITGAAPSAVRAFLMVFFFWGARFCVREPNPVAALANSALLVLLLFPQQLWNPGFQLSYAVVAGILFLGLPLGRRLQEKWTPFSGLPRNSMSRLETRVGNAIRYVAMMLAVSLSATLLSSPLSIHYFDTFAPGAVLLNLLLIPSAALVIVSGFISVFLNLFGLGAVAVLFNHAGWLVITLMEEVVQIAPVVPAFFWEARFLSPWQGPLTAFAVLGSLLVCAHRKWQGPYFHFVMPFLLFVLFLSTAARLTFPGN